MPNGDYYPIEPSKSEVESRELANLLILATRKLGAKPEGWMVKAANDHYGNSRRVNELRDMLHAACNLLNDDVIYNGRDKDARKLADWWDEYQEKKKVEAALEKENEERETTRRQALEKLTQEEREALGLCQ